MRDASQFVIESWHPSPLFLSLFFLFPFSFVGVVGEIEGTVVALTSVGVFSLSSLWPSKMNRTVRTSSMPLRWQ